MTITLFSYFFKRVTDYTVSLFFLDIPNMILIYQRDKAGSNDIKLLEQQNV